MPSSLYAVVASADASRTSGNAARRGGPHDAIHFYVAHPVTSVVSQRELRYCTLNSWRLLRPEGARWLGTRNGWPECGGKAAARRSGNGKGRSGRPEDAAGGRAREASPR